MADRNSLGVLGYVFGGVTGLVMMAAVTVVLGHLEGRLALDPAPSQVVAVQH